MALGHLSITKYRHLQRILAACKKKNGRNILFVFKYHFSWFLFVLKCFFLLNYVLGGLYIESNAHTHVSAQITDPLMSNLRAWFSTLIRWFPMRKKKKGIFTLGLK